MVTYGIVIVVILIVALFIYFKNKDKNIYQEDIPKKPQEQEARRPSHNLKERTKQNRIEPKKVPSAKAIREAEEKKAEKQKLEQKRHDEEKIRERLLNEKRIKKQKRKEEREKAELAKKQKEQDNKLQQENKKLEEEKVQTETEPKIVSTLEATKTIDLPECKYPKFDYSRLIGMGLGEDEAMEFIRELIPQIKTQIPLIQEAIDASDFHNIERLTHSIKGSSTTVGTGGVADLLVEFNTYVKTEKEIPVIEAYLKHLEFYCNELEKEYS